MEKTHCKPSPCDDIGPTEFYLEMQHIRLGAATAVVEHCPQLFVVKDAKAYEPVEDDCKELRKKALAVLDELMNKFEPVTT
jgi:hypothetical protein